MQALKNAAISAQIVAKMAEGLTIREAIDAVLGAGTVENLISDLYHDLRAKQGL